MTLDEILEKLKQRQSAAPQEPNTAQKVLGGLEGIFTGQGGQPIAELRQRKQQEFDAGTQRLASAAQVQQGQDQAAQKQQAAQAKAQEAADNADSSSKASQKAQQLASLIPGISDRLGENLTKLSSDDLKELLPSLSKAIERGAKADAAKLDREFKASESKKAREATAQRDALKFQRDQALKAQDLDVKAINKNDERAQKVNDNLAKELRGHPVTKETNGIISAAQRVKAAAADPSAAGDLALIFNFMKVLDPGSTVREGEFANAQNSGGLPSRISATYNSIINGKRLEPSQRKDFLNRTLKLADSSLDRLENINEEFQGAAERQGGDPSVVVDTEGVSRNRELLGITSPERTQERRSRIEELKAKLGKN